MSDFEQTGIGPKHDKGKPRFSLLPHNTVEQIVLVLEFGAIKYHVDSWKKVPNARIRYYDAVMRHLSAWFQGQKIDPETGLNHLAHAACGLLFLLWFDMNP